jgi:trans-feruloyl-CoA hydratase/vanillin synthase
MTGRTFDGQRAGEMGLVNYSVPREHLRGEVEALVRDLLDKNPVVLTAAKLGFKHAFGMSDEQAEDYFCAELERSQFQDAERGRERGLAQFSMTRPSAPSCRPSQVTRIVRRTEPTGAVPR